MVWTEAPSDVDRAQVLTSVTDPGMEMMLSDLSPSSDFGIITAVSSLISPPDISRASSAYTEPFSTSRKLPSVSKVPLLERTELTAALETPM